MLFSQNIKTILLLTTCFALSTTTSSLTASAASIVGFQIAGSKALATLPITFQLMGTTLAGIPASLLMKRIGRRYGFMFGTLLGIIGAGTASVSIINKNFPLFCISIFCLGMLNGFGQLYRFAAADMAEPDFKAKAVSFVMAGGILAGFIGPTIASETMDLILLAPFAGSYLVIISFYLLIILILFFIKIAPPNEEEQHGEKRALKEIMSQPKFMIAVFSAMIGYGVMSLIMTATPLAMTEGCGHPFVDAAFVIQWHIVGMFAPSFFTGSIIQRFGPIRVILMGALIYMLCITINLSGTEVFNFWAALLLLGIGWNFMFVSATTMITETYKPAEKAMVQGVNDLFVFGTAAISSLLAGVIQTKIGWEAVNWSVIPFLVFVLFALSWYQLKYADKATVV